MARSAASSALEKSPAFSAASAKLPNSEASDWSIASLVLHASLPYGYLAISDAPARRLRAKQEPLALLDREAARHYGLGPIDEQLQRSSRISRRFFAFG